MDTSAEYGREEVLSALKLKLEKGLEELAPVVAMLLAVKDSPAGKVYLDAVPQFAAILKPWIQDVSDFFTELDIAAVKKMEAAGISQENAVALQRTSIVYALLPSLAKTSIGRKAQNKP